MKVDVIIPCYYTSNIIRPCLTSVAKQITNHEITLVMVNDCSPNTDCEYEDLINEFKDQINIQYLKTSINSGPGVARQLGLDNATGDWVMFIDDDDQLYDKQSIERLLTLSNSNTICISGCTQVFNEYLNTTELRPPIFHTQGTIYNRHILKKENIQFDKRLSFREEDGAFSDLVLSYNNKYRIAQIPNIVYLKKNTLNNTSITGRKICSINYINLIGLKSVLMSYRGANIIENLVVIANILDYFTHNLTYTMNKIEYEHLVSFIKDTEKYLNNLNYNEKICEEYLKIYNDAFPDGDFGLFNYDSVIKYMKHRYDWLEELRSRICE